MASMVASQKIPENTAAGRENRGEREERGSTQNLSGLVLQPFSTQLERDQETIIIITTIDDHLCPAECLQYHSCFPRNDGELSVLIFSQLTDSAEFYLCSLEESGGRSAGSAE